MKYKLLIINPAARYGVKAVQIFFSDVEQARKAAKDMVGDKDYEGCQASIYLLSETLVESVNLDAPVTTK
jgi:hypothetical protein